MVAITHTLGYLATLPLLSRLPRKKAIGFCCLTSTLCGLVLVVEGLAVRNGDPNQLGKYTEIMCGVYNNVLFCFFISLMYAYVVEVYPTHLRSSGVALVFFVGNIYGCLNGYFSDLSLYFDMNAMTACCLPLVLGIIPLLYLPETINNKKMR